MKEHPDYKYRPRRKPKSGIKKENKFGFALPEHHGHLATSISRGLIPPPLGGPPGSGLNHPLIGHHADDLKITRFFPPFPYPLYPIQHKMGEDFGAAFQAIYGSGGSFYSGHQGVAWPGLSAPNCLQVNCGCPSPTKDLKRPNYFPGKPEDRPFPSPARPEDDRFSLESKDSKDFRKYSDDSSYETSCIDRHQPLPDDEKSQDRYSTTSSSPPQVIESKSESKPPLVLPPATTSSTSPKLQSNFSVQSLTGNTRPSSPRSHVI